MFIALVDGERRERTERHELWCRYWEALAWKPDGLRIALDKHVTYTTHIRDAR